MFLFLVQPQAVHGNSSRSNSTDDEVKIVIPLQTGISHHLVTQTWLGPHAETPHTFFNKEPFKMLQWRMTTRSSLVLPVQVTFNQVVQLPKKIQRQPIEDEESPTSRDTTFTTSRSQNMADSTEVKGDPPLREVAFLTQGGVIPFAVAIGSAHSPKPHRCHPAIDEGQHGEWCYRLHPVMASKDPKATNDVCFAAEPLVCGRQQSGEAHSGGESTSYGYLLPKQNRKAVQHIAEHLPREVHFTATIASHRTTTYKTRSLDDQVCSLATPAQITRSRERLGYLLKERIHTGCKPFVIVHGDRHPPEQHEMSHYKNIDQERSPSARQSPRSSHVEGRNWLVVK